MYCEMSEAADPRIATMSPGIAPLWRRQFANKLGFRTVAIAQGASSRKLAAFTPTGGGDASPVTFWVGSNHGASIVKLEPLD